ncbi:MAG: thioesterase family protein [Gordonia sp. (in: high G+C Gram-positive bacteria)]
MEAVEVNGVRRPHEVEVALRWGDMDVLGHVNNVQVARLFEEARVRAMTDWSEGTVRPTPMVVARQEIEFAAPLYYSVEPACCQVWVSRIGGKSFDFSCALRSATGELSALCETTLTALDADSGRPVELPAALLTALRANVGEPAPFRRRRTATV